MKKRILALLLVLVMAFSFFAGCGEDKTETPSADGSGTSQDEPTPDKPGTDDPSTEQPGNQDKPSDDEPQQPGTTEPGTQDKPDPTHKHTDANGDEKCDECQKSVVTLVDFYVLNDLHGKFCDTDTQIGVDEMATYLRQSKSTDDHAVFLSTGDMWQGSGESNLTNGAILIEWMNELDFVGMTLGNHEFDWGEDIIRKNKELAEFPFLAINIFDNQTGKLSDYCTPSIMVECGDIQVGIIGAIGDCHSSISGDYNKGFTFKVGNALTNLVKAESDRLRGLGADLIVYAIHDGHGRGNDSAQTIGSAAIKSYYDVALSDGYVDVVFEAHSHQKYILIDEKGVYHIQGGGENYGVSHIEIKVNTVTDDTKVTDAKVVPYSAYQNLADDAATEDIEKKYAQSISHAYDILGRVDKVVTGDELGDLMAKYYLDIAQERWGSKYDIVLGGGYIKTRSPYDMSGGGKTYADLLSLFPFDNRLVLCSISGSKLLSQFINTSNGDYHIALSEYGKSILGSIDRNKTYYIMTDSYSSTYAPNGLTEVAEYDSGIFARDLLASALKRGEFEVNHDNYKLTDIATLIDIGIYFGPNAEGFDYYYVKGNVKDQPNATYGNFTLTDGKKSIFVYGIKDLQGNNYSAMSQKLEIGDEVVIYGRLKRYVNKNTGEDTLEIIDGVLIKHTKKEDIPTTPTTPSTPSTPSTPTTPDKPQTNELTSIADALSIGAKLAKGQQTTQNYNIKGMIKEIKSTVYGNMYIEDGAGNQIYIYGIVGEKGGRFDSLGYDLAVGDTITVTAPILNYYNANSGESMVELKNAVITKIEKGSAAVKTMSITNALEMGKNIAAGQMTADKYNFEGVVESEPHSTYGNFYLSDGKGNAIYVYGLYDSAGKRYDAMTTKLKIGDKVLISGPILNYVNPNTGEQKIEIKDATFISKIS